MTVLKRDQQSCQQSGQQIPAGGMSDAGQLRHERINAFERLSGEQMVADVMQGLDGLPAGEVLQ